MYYWRLDKAFNVFTEEAGIILYLKRDCWILLLISSIPTVFLFIWASNRWFIKLIILSFSTITTHETNQWGCWTEASPRGFQVGQPNSQVENPLTTLNQGVWEKKLWWHRGFCFCHDNPTHLLPSVKGSWLCYCFLFFHRNKMPVMALYMYTWGCGLISWVQLLEFGWKMERIYNKPYVACFVFLLLLVSVICVRGPMLRAFRSSWALFWHCGTKSARLEVRGRAKRCRCVADLRSHCTYGEIEWNGEIIWN